MNKGISLINGLDQYLVIQMSICNKPGTFLSLVTTLHVEITHDASKGKAVIHISPLGF